MKALKTILIVVLALFGIWLIASLIAPSGTDVLRTKEIAASPELIYGYVSKLRNQDEWGVWVRSDKDAKYGSEGTDGTVGFKITWDGDTVMQGSQTITELVQNESVKTDLAFGDFMTSKISLDMKPVEAGTEVSWSLKNEIPFQGRAMMMLMGMRSQIEKDFETGLDSLKAICERMAASSPKNEFRGYKVDMVDRPEMVYVGKRAMVKWADMEKFYGDHFPAIAAAVGAAKLEMAGMPSGIIFKWDEPNQQADMMAAVPVKGDAATSVKGWETLVVPAGKAQFIPYMGGYHGSYNAHMAMGDAMKANGRELKDHVIEEYITDPMSEPDSMKWLTNIYYMMK